MRAINVLLTAHAGNTVLDTCPLRCAVRACIGRYCPGARSITHTYHVIYIKWSISNDLYHVTYIMWSMLCDLYHVICHVTVLPTWSICMLCISYWHISSSWLFKFQSLHEWLSFILVNLFFPKRTQSMYICPSRIHNSAIVDFLEFNKSPQKSSLPSPLDTKQDKAQCIRIENWDSYDILDQITTTIREWIHRIKGPAAVSICRSATITTHDKAPGQQYQYCQATVLICRPIFIMPLILYVGIIASKFHRLSVQYNCSIFFK